MTELKPCPFCGSNDIVVNDSIVFWCECLNCRVETLGYSTKEEAVEAWNMRKGGSGMTENKHGFMPKQEITIGGIAFTIIQTALNWVKCIASECISEGTFDTKNRNDFAVSDIRAFLNGEFLQKLIDAGAPEEMFEYFNIDLTADDGLKDYGGDRVRVGLITCDEYRLLRGNIPELPDTWWWTATPDSPKNNSVQFVDSDGTLNSVNACYGFYGVRPLCVLKSEILKSYLDGNMKKRAEAVDMMKHIAEVWNIKPEEIFIPEIEKGESIV